MAGSQAAGTPSSTGATPPPPRDSEPQYFTHEQIMVVLVGPMAGMFLAALDQSILGVALPRIVSDLGGLDQLSWVITAYLLTSTASTPLWGKISDLYGRRLIFQVAIVTFMIGSVLCGLAQDMPQLIAFRAIQGLGGGGLFAIAFAIIGDIISPRERGRYHGHSARFGVLPGGGTAPGGWFTDGPGWRWIFFINIPIGIAALIVISIRLNLPVIKREHSLDFLGAALIVASVSALLLYLDWGGTEYGWGSPEALGLLALSLVLAVLFIFAELRAREPIIPMRLFPQLYLQRFERVRVRHRPRPLRRYHLPAALLPGGQRNVPDGVRLLAMLPTVIGIMSFSILSGQLITCTGKYKIFPVLGAVIVTGGLLILSRITVDTPYWQIAIAALILGCGIGFSMQTVVVAVQNAVDVRDMGAATSSSPSSGPWAAIGTAICGATLTNRLAHYLDDAASAGAIDLSTIDANNVQSIRA